ncbi:FtsZ/tubulin family protein [Geoglobus acetivorans]|uniref:GTPase domain protein n=1 Tax=Geoglobus acetivorans TaxID=565033 RepID=A0A0A7GG85_GEOAI|nr:GTPase domain protein [Geoglobus acetivorans]
MKLLTIGTGDAVWIADLFASRGARVNNISLFKTFAVVNSVDKLKSIRHVDDKRRFYTVFRDGDVDVRSAFNSILSFNELYEASLVVCDVEDEFSFYSAVRFGDELEVVTEEPRLCIAMIPELSDASSVSISLLRVKKLMNSFDYVFVFEKTPGFEHNLLKAFNVLSLVGEIDARKRLSGEVVVDTSDFLNSLSGDGVTVTGTSGEILPFKIIRRLRARSSSTTIAERTERMVRLYETSLTTIGARFEIESARKALVVFSGDPDEITMDGMFECIKAIERMNPEMLVRYGDYPIPNSREINIVTVFSGIKKFKL